MALYMGIDAGGSKTECAIASGDEILAISTGGSCKIQQVGRDQAAKNLVSVVRSALLDANVTGTEIHHCYVGMSGLSLPEVEPFLKGTLRLIVGEAITAVGDHIIAHEAAFRGGSGILIISGTGSIVYGRNQRGRIARVGGRGPEVSDEGSGFWIGREAVAAIARGQAGQASPLSQRVTRCLHVKSAEDLTTLLERTPPPAFADLFPEILTASKDGDLVARKILNRAGKELANLALHAIATLWPESGNHETDEPIHIAGAGGVLTNSEEVRDALRQAILAQRSDAIYDQRVIRPVEGAIYLARTAEASAHATPQG
jgi:glucosamine kinase